MNEEFGEQTITFTVIGKSLGEVVEDYREQKEGDDKMQVVFEENRLTEVKDEVVVGQLRRSHDGIYAIITNGRDREHPFNAVMVAVDEKMYGHEDGDLVWSINWGQNGTDSEGIRDEFPIRVSGTLSISGDK